MDSRAPLRSSAAHREHRRLSPRSLRAAILTISDTRTERTDRSGRLIHDRLVKAGHRVADQRIVPDEGRRIRAVVRAWTGRSDLDALILTGGTGVSPRDGTIEAVEKLLSKKLEGFGELFRYLSYAQVGAAAYLSRAMAGVAGDKALFSLPGSEKAVALAMDRLILPELPHLVQQLRKRE